MFRKLHRERSGWNLRVLNLAVTNMAAVAGDGKHNSGQDIGKMFQRPETEHRDQPELKNTTQEPSIISPAPSVVSEPTWESDEEDSMIGIKCTICGAMVPHFARVAHEVYHSDSSQ